LAKLEFWRMPSDHTHKKRKKKKKKKKNLRAYGLSTDEQDVGWGGMGEGGSKLFKHIFLAKYSTVKSFEREENAQGRDSTEERSSGLVGKLPYPLTIRTDGSKPGAIPEEG